MGKTVPFLKSVSDSSERQVQTQQSVWGSEETEVQLNGELLRGEISEMAGVGVECELNLFIIITSYILVNLLFLITLL